MLNYKPKFIVPEHEQDFEILCDDVYSETFNCSMSNMYGRRGQKQYGLDVVVYKDNLNKDSHRIGIQCKHVKSLSFDGKSGDSVMKEVRKAEQGKQKISQLIIATSLPADTNLTDAVNEESSKRVKEGKFPISINFIQDIENHINKHSALTERYIHGKTHQSLINECQKLINKEQYLTPIDILTNNLNDMNRNEQFKALILLCFCCISLDRKNDFNATLAQLFEFGRDDDNLEVLKIQQIIYSQGISNALGKSSKLVEENPNNIIFKENELVLKLVNGEIVNYDNLDDYYKNRYSIIEQMLWSLLTKESFNIKEFNKIYDTISSIDKKRPSAIVLRLHADVLDCYKNHSDIQIMEKSLSDFEYKLDIEAIESAFYKEAAVNMLISANARLLHIDKVKNYYNSAKIKSIPINIYSINNAIIALIQENEKKFFDELFNDFFNKDSYLVFIDGLIHFRDFDKIKEIIAIENQVPSSVKNTLFSYMITERNNVDEVLEFIQDRNLLEDNDILGLIFLAKYFFDKNDDVYQEINKKLLLVNANDNIDKQKLSLYFYETKQFHKTVEIYQTNNDFIKKEIHCINFIRSLININNYQQAKIIIETNLDLVSNNLEFYNIINELCRISTDWTLSKRAFEKLKNCEQYSWYWCMKIQFSDKRFPIIKSIPEKFSDNSPRNICWIAYQELTNKRTESGKNRLLRLWREDPDNIEILQNLENIFIEALKNSSLGNIIFGNSYDTVIDGCCAFFTKNNRNDYIFIDSKINPEKIDNELYFHGSDDFSTLFMDKKQGDVFEIEDRLGFSETIKIKEIHSILHGLFYHISEKSKKTNSPFKLKAMEIDTSPKGIEKFLKITTNIAEKQNKAIVDGLDIYRENPLPISTFSKYWRISMINICYNWSDNLNYPLHLINNFTPNDRNLKNEYEIKNFAIDIFSLIEIQRINLISYLDNKNIYITNHILNDLKNEIDKPFIEDKILKNIFNKKETYEYNPKIKDDLNSLIDFLENYTEVCPAYGSNIDNDYYEQLKDMLLEVDLSTLRLCKEKELPLLSFDTRLRAVANLLNIETINLNEYLKITINNDDVFYEIQVKQFFDNRSPDFLTIGCYIKNMLKNQFNLNKYLIFYLKFIALNFKNEYFFSKTQELFNIQSSYGFYLSEDYKNLVFKILSILCKKYDISSEKVLGEDFDFSVLDTCDCFLIKHGTRQPTLSAKKF